MSEKQRVIVVTGASRGVGKGTALGLAREGHILYLSGRSKHQGHTTELPGFVQQAVDEASARGAQAHAVICDHQDDSQVRRLIQRVLDEQGRIDLLVNNVYQVPDDLLAWKPFWKRPVNAHWQAMIDLGLRAHYVAAHCAAPAMVQAGQGAIVTISSPASRAYIHSVIYGIGKAGKDKMMQDMAKELREHNVAAFGLWPGIVKTERLQPALDADALPPEYEVLKPGMESPEFTGRILFAVLEQEKAMSLSGRSWWNSELAKSLGVTDIDGTQPESYAEFMGNPAIATETMIK